MTLLHCSGHWTCAESNPETLEALLRNEIQQGWVKEFPGSIEEAKQQWPQRGGKLNLVFADGKEPRLVLDSSVCNANQLCSIPEHVALPSSLDVRRSFMASNRYRSRSGLALDVKAARKRVKVRPSDQGALLFAWQGKLYYYTVCQFGAKFSAYWWQRQRIGAQIVRVLRCMIRHLPHGAWLYVDDLLLLLSKSHMQDSACLVIALLSVLGVPISWRKAQLGAHVTWCGWTFQFDQETVRLTTEKLAKLRKQLLELQQSKKILRKKLESSLGLLMWSTSTCRHLRPYLAPLYRDLRSAKGTLKQIHAQQWLPFLDALNSEAIVARQPLGVWLPLHARVINVGSIQVQCKADIPKVPPGHKATWIRIADLRRAEIHL